MPRSFVTPRYGISEQPCSFGTVLLHSFAALIHVYDHANRLFVSLFCRSLVPSGGLLFVLWEACKSALGVGVADGRLGSCMSHICGALIEGHSLLFILQNPVALVVGIRKPIQRLGVPWVKFVSRFEAAKCLLQGLFSFADLLLDSLKLQRYLNLSE